MKDSTKRKLQSENILNSQGIPLNAHLPEILDDREAILKAKEEIIDRAFALAIVSGKAMGGSKKKVKEFIQRYGADAFFTRKEQIFISSLFTKKQDKINFTWKLESLWVLLWSLGLISDLGSPKNLCNVDLTFETILGFKKEELLTKVQLKTLPEVLDELDIVYRMHWAVREAHLKSFEIPPQLDPGVVMERHYALNWLIGKDDWDDVSTNT
ncbi:DUF4272 domain-containing protein [Rummeliibacillus pycnus]|uniref:DUF4272 domain-containing protein n=1 Tax=Rummeliibacillus pycnus TaxID=101070 RepID=UPI003D2C9438